MHLRLISHFFISLLLLCTLTACSRESLVRQESYVFGTRVEVLCWGSDEAQAQTALGEVLREFDRLHRTYHAWQDSSLTALNASLAKGERATVAPEMEDLLHQAQRFSALSEGLFDPAIGGLVAAWGFQRDEFSARMPSPDTIARLLAQHPRMADIMIGEGVASSSNRAVQLDFGGLVKGYALDRAASILRKNGIRNALINIGGNILALGAKGDLPWQVGIQRPRGSGPMATISLYDGEAIGTSGDYQRYFEVDGRRYSHLIDPRSGQPSEVSQAATELVSSREAAGVLSDVASKPIFLSGEGWPHYASAMRVTHVLRVTPAGSVELSPAMQARVQWVGKPPALVVRPVP